MPDTTDTKDAAPKTETQQIEEAQTALQTPLKAVQRIREVLDGTGERIRHLMSRLDTVLAELQQATEGR